MPYVKAFAVGSCASTLFAALAGTMAGFSDSDGTPLFWLLDLYLSVARAATSVLSGDLAASFNVLLVGAFFVWALIFGVLRGACTRRQTQVGA